MTSRIDPTTVTIVKVLLDSSRGGSGLPFSPSFTSAMASPGSVEKNICKFSNNVIIFYKNMISNLILLFKFYKIKKTQLISNPNQSYRNFLFFWGKLKFFFCSF